MFPGAVYIEHVQRRYNAVEHFRAANGKFGRLLRHLQLMDVVFPSAQDFDFLIAGKFVAGNLSAMA